MVKKGSSFAKIGAIILSVVMGLGLMGVGVSYWSESLIISGTVETGTWGVQLSEEIDCYTDPLSDNISCSVTGNVLGVAIISPYVGVHYYCEFDLDNAGTIPVKVQSADVDPVDPMTLPAGVEVEVTDMTGGDLVGIQIDGGQTLAGTVYVYLSNDTSQGTDFDFTVTFTSIIWNQ